MNKTDLIFFYNRDLEKLVTEIESYQNEENIWKIAPGISNSAGHLAQHLIGNLRTFVGNPLGGISYVRNRDEEFNSINFSYTVLLQELRLLKEDIVASIERIPDLNAAYPDEIKAVKEGEQSIGFILTHLLAHLSYHLGQINYHRRLLG